MDRSPGFGSTTTDLSPYSDLVSLRLHTLQLVNTGFQVLFHSPPGVLFTFPSQYYALSVTKKYLGLRGGPRSFRQGFSCLVLLWILPCRLSSVCPLSISLAATLEIDFSFSSSGYLDVSVHRVPFHTLCVGVWMTGVFPAGFPHSDISGSLLICSSPKLFAAYHVFLRLLVPRHPPCALDCLIS